MPSLRELLTVRWVLPVDVRSDGAVLLSSNETGTMQLSLVPAGGGESVRLTDFAEPVAGRFVPGTDRLLVEMDEGGNERMQLYLLDARPGSPLEPLVVEPDSLHVGAQLSSDGSLLAYACNRANGRDLEVFVRVLATGQERRVLSPGGFCWPAGFSPDGRWLGVLQLTDRTGDNDLILIDLEGDEAFVVEPEEQDAAFGAPAWTADGSRFHFATSSGRDTTGIARFDLADRSWSYVLEEAWDLECRSDPSGRRLLVEANVEGVSSVRLLDPETLALEHDLELPQSAVVQTLASSPDGRLLGLGLSTPRIPWSAWLADTSEGSLRRLSQPSPTVAEDALAQPSLRRYRSFDGESIPYWLLVPDETPPPWPVVVEVHGGPEAQRRPAWFPLIQYFVSAGFAVAMPNVRGSTGYGKRYEHLDDVRLRLDAVRDLVALHDHLGEDERFDTGRTALYGGSYGGFMVLAALALHPERWAAAVDVVGISSFVTFLENTAAWRRSFREREYGSLEHDRDFLHEISPLTHVDRMRAPLFIVHGANDPRVPLGEAQQIHAALRARGVPCELLVYDDEGHGLQKLANRLDAYGRAVAFLQEILR